MPIVLGLAVSVAILLIARVAMAPREKEKIINAASPLNTRLFFATLRLLPTLETVLKPGDPIVDTIYGGRLPDAYGGPTFGYYQTYLNADHKSGGTTCGITLAYLMGKAGWPKEMINRKETDPVPGAGFVPGMHIAKMVGEAKKKGWYVEKPKEFYPGDAYHIDHPEKPNSDHVGAIVNVGEPRADGTRLVETADGGQGRPGYSIHRNIRVLSADGQTLSLDGVPARVLGVIRPKAEAIA